MPRDFERSSDSGTSDSDFDDDVRRSQQSGLLRFSTNMSTWASEYPFPTFKPRRKANANAVENETVEVDAEDDARPEDTDSSDDEGDDTENPGQSRAPQCRIAAPHPLASDWAFELHMRPWAAQLAEFAQANRTLLNSSSLNRSGSARRGSMSFSRKMMDDLGVTRRAALPSCPPVTLEEAGALLSLMRGAEGSVARPVDLSLMDLSWLGKRHPEIPNCHLHLANLHLRIDDADEKDCILINSPRSAVVLLRRGVPLRSLLRRPWAKKRFTHAAHFGALDTLSVEERKEYGLERLRCMKLEEVVEDYRALCTQCEQEDIATLCEQVLLREEHLKQLKSVRPASSLSRASSPGVHTAVADISTRVASRTLSFLRKRLEDARSTTETTVMNSHLAVRARLVSGFAERTAANINERAQSAARQLNATAQKRHEQNVLRQGQLELSRMNRLSSASSQVYRHVVLEQRSQRRHELAESHNEAKHTTSVELANARRTGAVTEDKVLRALHIHHSRLR